MTEQLNAVQDIGEIREKKAVVNILVVVIPDLMSYIDRVMALQSIGRGRVEVIVICKDASPGIVAKCDNVKFISPRSSLRGSYFAFWAARSIINIYSSSCKQGFVVLEFASGFVISILRLLLRERPTLAILLVMPCITVLREKGWSVDKFASKVRGVQRLRIVKQWFTWALRERIFATMSDVVIANSVLNIEELGDLLNRKRTALLPNSVTRISEYDASALRETVTGALRIVIVSEIEPHKGIGTAFEVLRRLKRNGIVFSCLLVGRLRKVNEKWFNSTKNSYPDLATSVHWIEKVDRLALEAIYSTSDVLLMTSFYEGSPRVVLEAAAFGCHIVASKISGTAYLDPNSDFMFLFESGNVDECVGKIIENFSKYRDKRRKQKVSETVMQKFSVDRWGSNLIKILSGG